MTLLYSPISSIIGTYTWNRISLTLFAGRHVRMFWWPNFWTVPRFSLKLAPLPEITCFTNMWTPASLFSLFMHFWSWKPIHRSDFLLNWHVNVKYDRFDSGHRGALGESHLPQTTKTDHNPNKPNPKSPRSIGHPGRWDSPGAPVTGRPHCKPPSPFLTSRPNAVEYYIDSV